MSLALAEMHYTQGNNADANRMAKRALAILPAQSPAWFRASDVEAATDNKLKKKN